MPMQLDDVLVVAISSRALFDFEDAHQVFNNLGEQAYQDFQLQKINEPAKPGPAFPLVQKLLRFNNYGKHRVEVLVLSRNDPVSGLRVFRSAEELKLDISRGAFTKGAPPFRYLKPFRANLFLSADADDVKEAIAHGIPAARVFVGSAMSKMAESNELRIAFDGDAVLFDDSAERVYQEKGIEGFHAHEREKRDLPLPPGPFKPFLAALHALQVDFKDHDEIDIRTAMVTARNAPAHDRAVRTLLSWNLQVDEAFFLGGLSKGEFLSGFQPDFFFDDHLSHCDSAAPHTAVGHVNYGVANEIAAELPSPVKESGVE